MNSCCGQVISDNSVAWRGVAESTAKMKSIWFSGWQCTERKRERDREINKHYKCTIENIQRQMNKDVYFTKLRVKTKNVVA